MKTPYVPLKAVVFDLDGTLVYSIPDILHAVNSVVSCIGMKNVTEDRVIKAVGNGVEELLRSLGVPGEWVDPLSLAMASIYAGMKDSRSTPYEGIPELLHTLQQDGVQVCVLSNKPQGGVERSLLTHFPEFRFSMARGSLPGKPAKPGGEALGRMMAELGYGAHEVVMCGDGESDILASSAAGVSCISVLWGYRSREELQRAGGRLFAETPGELAVMLEKTVPQQEGNTGGR
jgi:phosphoglycolate phosphatase